MDGMDPSSAQHHQETLESMLVCTTKSSSSQQEQDPKKHPNNRPQPEHSLKCPRCDSTNTKFCYYNNYSLTQPRYFCKSCRRYWTKGGTLRNVPVGGGCRKNKRSSSSKNKSPQISSSPNPSPLSGLCSYDSSSSDLSLAFARLQKHQSGGFDGHDLSLMAGNNTNSNNGIFGFMEGQQQHGYQNLCYGGIDSGNIGLVGNNYENGGMGINVVNHGQGVINYDQQDQGSSIIKQEYNNSSIERELVGEGRVLWGFPWQIGGGHENLGGEFENTAAGRESWNGIGATWHGLLNSPLM